ncbi:MAG: MBL fold metallo-hydrolase [Sphingobacteriales bacterium]|nr:MAG: MBL fold metallo-hydrolase [Sphingobacteriales bacterium]
MKITFLGTGTSQGVPVIGCNCAVCTSTDKRDNRLRTSVWVETPEASIVIDSGPDFRYQMLRAKVRNLDAIIFTHSHKDHIAGLDDVRAYNYFSGKAMEIYATEETQDGLRREFHYVFNNRTYPGIPQLNLNTITNKPFYINGLEIVPIRVLHYKLEVFGFRIGGFTYITDANYIAPEELEKAKGSDVFVLNALRHEKHISHYNLPEAMEIANSADVKNAYFLHISHQLGLHEEVTKMLPDHMHLAYDGLELHL